MATARVNRRAPVAVIFALYAFFFLLWCLGLFLGFLGGMPEVFGMPLWFAVSCVGAYAAICVILVWAVRRYF